MASPIGYDGGLTCAIAVTDLDRAIRWYQDVLGFQLLYKLEEMGWCELRTEVRGVNVGLSKQEKAGAEGGATLTFGVKDIEAARAHLEGKEVRLEGAVHTIEGMVRLLYFRDPDGNLVSFYQDLEKKT